MVSLKGNNIQLRTLETNDIDWLFAVENDEKFWEISNTTQAFTKEELAAYIAHAHIDIYTAKQYRFVIVCKNERVGLIDLFDYDSQHQRAGVGILILPKFQVKGYATEALALLIAHSFKHLKMHQLYATVATDNLNSIRLFQKLHFKIMGTKKDWIFINNRYKDTHSLQLINKDDQ